MEAAPRTKRISELSSNNKTPFVSPLFRGMSMGSSELGRSPRSWDSGRRSLWALGLRADHRPFGDFEQQRGQNHQSNIRVSTVGMGLPSPHNHNPEGWGSAGRVLHMSTTVTTIIIHHYRTYVRNQRAWPRARWPGGPATTGNSNDSGSDQQNAFEPSLGNHDMLGRYFGQAPNRLSVS